MPTSADDQPELLVDTSVAVALVVSDHEHHAETFDAIAARRLGLSGHAAFEAFSVLTRLPPPARRTPAAVARLLESNFPGTRFLSTPAAHRLLRALADSGISGGAVHDALVGAAAVEHEIPLVTRDRRALDTYRLLGAEVQLLG